jgi:hypothetical protein
MNDADMIRSLIWQNGMLRGMLSTLVDLCIQNDNDTGVVEGIAARMKGFEPVHEYEEVKA